MEKMGKLQIRRRNLLEQRGRLRPQDLPQFYRTCIELGFRKDWDLVEDGKTIARCSSKERL